LLTDLLKRLLAQPCSAQVGLTGQDAGAGGLNPRLVRRPRGGSGVEGGSQGVLVGQMAVQLNGVTIAVKEAHTAGVQAASRRDHLGARSGQRAFGVEKVSLRGRQFGSETRHAERPQPKKLIKMEPLHLAPASWTSLRRSASGSRISSGVCRNNCSMSGWRAMASSAV